MATMPQVAPPQPPGPRPDRIYPTLTPAQVGRITPLGRRRRVEAGEVLVEAGEHARLESAHVAEKHTLQPELLLECSPNRQALDVKILRMESVRVESARDPAVDSTEVRGANQKRPSRAKRREMSSHELGRIIEVLDQAKQVDDIELR